MALGTPATIGSKQGQAPGRPAFAQRMQFAGDDATPAGGTVNFAATYLVAELGITPTVMDVVGYGYTGAALTHLVRYVESTDALQVYTLAAGTEATGDLSGVSFDVTVIYR